MAPSARSARRFHCSAVISYGWVMAGVSWSGAGHGCGVERVACGGTDVLGVEVVALAAGTVGVALDAVERGPELLDLLGELAGFGLVVALDGVVCVLLLGLLQLGAEAVVVGDDEVGLQVELGQEFAAVAEVEADLVVLVVRGG